MKTEMYGCFKAYRFTRKEREWIYDKWCQGYTQEQLAECFDVHSKTIGRLLADKPRIRPILTYDDFIKETGGNR